MPALGNAGIADYTLVIPTHNRPAFLGQLLRYLRACEVSFPILILDSSNPDGQLENAQAVKSSSLDITHQTFDSALPVDHKLRRGIGTIHTPFFSFCADDDVVFPAALEDAVSFLRNHADYQVAQGYCVGFRETGVTFALTSVIYSNPSVDQDSGLGRVHALISRYQPIYYGVTRTETWQRSMQRVDRVEGFLFKEFLPGCETVIFGKMVRLPRIYSGRRMGNEFADVDNIRNFTGHPVHWFLRSPSEFFAKYVDYRNEIINALADAGELSVSREETARGLDVLHLGYMMLDPEMAYRHAEEVLGLIAPRDADEVSLQARTDRMNRFSHTPEPPTSGIRGITMMSDGSRSLGRRYHLSTVLLNSLASKLLARTDLLDVIQMLDRYH